jgi:hypothetical protein
MKLKSFGCSHIFGSDHQDQDPQTLRASQTTWPALLAKHLDYPYECYAQAGIGNLRIAEHVLVHAAQEPAVFVINWTYIDRFDYIHPATNAWASIRPGQTDGTSNTYYRQFHSEYRDKLTSLMQIKLCIDTLTLNNIPFIMCNTDELLFETKWHTSPAINKLQQLIQPHIKTFDHKNFIEYAKEKGHPTSAHDHVLESGHAACAEYAQLHFGIDKI